MPHLAVYGQTTMGKSWFMKRRAERLRRAQQQVLVHSGTGDTDWPAGCELFFEPDTFEAALNDQERFGATVIVDEASVLYGDARERKHPMVYRLGQMGRHRGFRCMFATQVPTTLHHRVRVNCPDAIVFKLGSRKYAQLVAEDYGLDAKATAEILDLPQLHFLEIKAGLPPVRRRLA